VRGSGSEASRGRSGGGRAPLSVELKISSRVGSRSADDEMDVDDAAKGCDDEDGEGSEQRSSAEPLP